MTTPQQEANRKADRIFMARVIAGTVSILGGLIMTLSGVMMGLRSTGETGDGDVVMIILGLALTAVVPAVAACRVLAALNRARRAWKRSLPPEQRAMVTAAELGAGAAVAWSLNQYWRDKGARMTRDVVRGFTGNEDEEELRMR